MPEKEEYVPAHVSKLVERVGKMGIERSLGFGMVLLLTINFDIYSLPAFQQHKSRG